MKNLNQTGFWLKPSYLLTTLLTLFLPLTYVGAEELVPIEALDVTGNNFSQTQTLDPIKPEEILPINRGTATSPSELLAPAPFQNNIIRNFEWTKRVPLDQLSQPIKVTYSLKGYNQQENLFSNQSNPRSAVNVVLKDEKSQLLFRDNERNIAVIQGSVQFVLDPSRARAGKHGGKLSVCILSRSGGCL